MPIVTTGNRFAAATASTAFWSLRSNDLSSPKSIVRSFSTDKPSVSSLLNKPANRGAFNTWYSGWSSRSGTHHIWWSTILQQLLEKSATKHQPFSIANSKIASKTRCMLSAIQLWSRLSEGVLKTCLDTYDWKRMFTFPGNSSGGVKSGITVSKDINSSISLLRTMRDSNIPELKMQSKSSDSFISPLKFSLKCLTAVNGM